MADLASLQVQLELQTAQFAQQMNNVNSQLDRLNRKVGVVGKTFSSIGNTIASFFTVEKLVGAFINAANALDEMATASEKLGVSVENLSALKYAAEQSDVSFETLTKGMRNLNKELATVDTSTSDAAKALRSLGVKGGDSPEVALKKISDAFADSEDAAQKTAVAMAIFGDKVGAEMIPMLNEGAAGIAALEERAKELGLVMDETSAKQAKDFNDRMHDMQAALGAVTTNIVSGMMPSMTVLSKAFVDSAKQGDGWKKVGEGIGKVMQILAAVGVAVAAVFQKVGTIIGAVGAAVVALFEDGFGAAASVVGELDSDLKRIDADARKSIDGLLTFNETVEETGKANAEGAKSGKALADAMGAIADPTKKAAKAQKELKQEMDPVTKLFKEIADQAKAREDAQTQLGVFGQLTPEMIDALKISAEDYAAMLERLKKSAGVWTELDEAMKKVAETSEKAAGITEAWDMLVEKLSSGEISVEQFEALARALQKMAPAIDEADTSADSFKKTVDELGEELATSIASNASNAMNDLIDSFGEAEFSFSDMINAMLKDIAKLITQMLIMKPLMDSIKNMDWGGMIGSIFTSANGNAFSGATGLPYGVYTRPTAFRLPRSGPLTAFARGGIFAEAGPEAIMPLQRNSQGELGVSASGAGVQVNVYNNTSSEVTTKESSGPDGQRVVDLYIDRRINERFSNGSMDKLMRSSYGLVRAPGG